jgi:hypothetical protein
MMRALMIAGAALLIAGPALADEVTTYEKSTTTTTTSEMPAVGSTTSTVVIAPTAPPAPRVEVPPPPPGPAVAWIPGHWSWSPGSAGYVWSAGRYAEPPRAHASWDAGRWVHHGHGWVWEEGHWTD